MANIYNTLNGHPTEIDALYLETSLLKTANFLFEAYSTTDIQKIIREWMLRFCTLWQNFEPCATFSRKVFNIYLMHLIFKRPGR